MNGIPCSLKQWSRFTSRADRNDDDGCIGGSSCKITLRVLEVRAAEQADKASRVAQDP